MFLSELIRFKYAPSLFTEGEIFSFYCKRGWLFFCKAAEPIYPFQIFGIGCIF